MSVNRRSMAAQRSKVRPRVVETGRGVADVPNAAIEQPSSSGGLSALLGDSQVVSRFNRAQQIQVVQQLQQTQGNSEVSRALAPTASGNGTVARAAIQRQPPSGQSKEYVPEMSVKPDAAEINVGQVHTERLAVLNAAKAPAQTTFHWGGAVGDSPTLGFVDINPHNGPKANMRVQGRAPGVDALYPAVEHQVPGGPPVDTPGPSPRITVKTPTVVMKATYREAAAGRAPVTQAIPRACRLATRW